MPILTRWVQYFQRGENTFRDGRQPFFADESELNEAVAEFDKWGKPLPVDYCHASLDTTTPNLPFPERFAAAGRILAVEVRESGLWGLTRFTEKCSSMIASGEMNWISPVFQVRMTAGKRSLWRMLGAGVTNDPALHGLQEITAASRGDIDQFAGPEVALNPEKATQTNTPGVTHMPKLAEIATRLGLPETATAEEVAAKGIELFDSLTLAKSALCAKLSLDPATATPASIGAAVDARLGVNGAPPAGFVTQASYDAIAAELATTVATLKASNATAFVEAAMRGNDKGEIKITPAQKEWALEWATRDMANFKEWLDRAPVQVVAKRELTNGKPAGTNEPTEPKPISIAEAANRLHGIELVK